MNRYIEGQPINNRSIICIPSSRLPSSEYKSCSSSCKVTWLASLSVTPIPLTDNYNLLTASQHPALLLLRFQSHSWMSTRHTWRVGCDGKHSADWLHLSESQTPGQRWFRLYSPLAAFVHTSFASHEFIHYSPSLLTPCGLGWGWRGGCRVNAKQHLYLMNESLFLH